MRKKSKRERVPNVLWTLYKDKARPLATTIVSLIPRNCDCNARGKCLRCIFGKDDDSAMSYLVRPDDPVDYRRFIKDCFVVLPDLAPPFPSLVTFTRFWSQFQIVERVIQSYFTKQTTPLNVMCHGNQTRSSIVKLLTQSTWVLALKRIGNSVMVYLLTHTLIFMPIKYNVHQQVAGPPVERVFGRSTVHPPSGSMDARNPKKKRRKTQKDTVSEEPPGKAPVKAVQFQQNSCYSVCIGDEYNLVTPCSEPSATPICFGDNDSHNLNIHEGKSIEIPVQQKLGKRIRQPSWQRRKRCKRLVLECSSTQMPSSKIPSIEDALNKTPEPNMQLLCPCCSVFQSVSQLPIDAQINRQPIFYNLKCSPSTFPEKHILNSLKPDFAGTKDLIQDIFGLTSMQTGNLPTLCFHKKGFCSYDSSCLYHSFVKSLKVLIRRAKQCQHRKLLLKHCPSKLNLQSVAGSELEPVLASPKQGAIQKDSRRGVRKKTPKVIQRQFGLIQPYCLKDEVVSFVWAVCRNILPPDLLGVSSCHRILRRNISKFIKLRRFEKFSLDQCMRKVEPSMFPVVSNKESSKTKYNTLKQVLLKRLIFWLFANIVVPLVQAHFYVTESELGRLNIYYYRKSVWKKLSGEITTRLKDQCYSPLNNVSVTNILRNRSFGFSKVRLSPKEAGARPIANLKTPSRFCIGKSRRGRFVSSNNRVTYFKSVNTDLRDSHLVIKDLKRREPERWGSTVFGYNDIYKKFRLFLRHIKEEHAIMPVVYLVVSDVQKAFDTIKQDKLLSILAEIQVLDRYTLQKSSEIFCRKKCIWFSEGIKLMSQGDDSGCSEVISSGRRRTFHSVSVNQGQSRKVKWEELLLILKEHLKNNVLKLGQHFFLQSVGIPQGSVLSTLLCTLYYEHLETNVIIPYVTKSAADVAEQDNSCHVALEATTDASFSIPESMLLRFVDDFLFISTSKKQATAFFTRLQRGFREYNCYMNQEKFCTNLDFGRLQPGSKRMLVGSDGVSFIQWSGLLIKSCSLEVQADYSWYLNDHLSSTLTVSWQRKPGRKLKSKLRAYMRPKCNPIFFDSIINSTTTIKLNVYQTFVLCAMKFHCYARELFTLCNIHPRSCFTSIEASLRYMYKLMKRRMFKVNSTSASQPPLQVSKEEVTCLGLIAYIRVLKQKKSRHKELLHMLRTKLAQFSRTASSAEVKYAVDDSHSSLLWRIRY